MNSLVAEFKYTIVCSLDQMFSNVHKERKLDDLRERFLFSTHKLQIIVTQRREEKKKSFANYFLDGGRVCS